MTDAIAVQGKHLVIHGRVQGVYYRYSMQQAAQSHGVSGWCRNLPDGSVEGEIWGAPEAVAAMLDWCRQGPPMAEVTRIDCTDLPEGAMPSDFEIRQ